MMAEKFFFHDKIFFYLLVLIAVTLPFFIAINSIVIFLLVFNWVLEGNWKKKKKMLLSNKHAIVWIIFYLYHVISLFYSENKSTGLFELEKKLVFLIFPLVLATSSTLDRKKLFIILRFFVAACFLAIIICLSNSIYLYLQGDDSYFFYHQLGAPIHFHAVYFSVYIGFSIFILVYFLQDGWMRFSNVFKITYIFLILLFLFFLLLLSSKTVSTSVLIVTVVYLVHIMFKRKKILIGILFFVFIPISALIIVSSSTAIHNRFDEVLKENYYEVLKLNDYQGFQFTGGTIRVAIWKSVVEILNQKNAWSFGVGVGDAQDLLTKHYVQKNIYPGDEVLGYKGFIDYNTHNQYMQFLITLGVVGLIIFLFILLWPIINGYKTHNILQILFIFVFCTFCFTESALCTHKGIIFFTFFNSLFVFSSFKKVNEDVTH